MESPLSPSFRNALGVIGIVAALCASVSDVLLQYSPGLPPGQPDNWAFISIMLEKVPKEQMIAGHYLGIYTIPLYVCGALNVWNGIAPSGSLATAFLLVSSFSITISAVYHGQVAHAGLCVKSSPPPLDAACPDTALLMQVQLVMASAVVAVQGVLLLVALFSGKHTFPAGKLFALVCNPLTVLAFLAIVARSMPVDQSNALLMASANLAYLGLFTISTMAQARMDAAPVEEKEIHCELE